MEEDMHLRSNDYNYTFTSLLEMIQEAKKYKNNRKRPRNERCAFNLDMEKLGDCIVPLKKLNNLIGMDEVKKNIIDQILFFSQELNTNEMMHTCLTGPPGVGKTTLGKILAELYCKLGFLKTDNFKVVSRVDLIAGYLGQTAIKTEKVLKSCIGGVLFIDEAYSVGSVKDDDSYSKECIDTINKFLSEHTSNFIMIIAGYRDELDKCFFSINQGLRRRFPWNYDIKEYTTKNLKDIFVYQVTENSWDFEKSIKLNNFGELETLFDKYKIFSDNGGDTLTLFDKAKICHSRRVFGKRKEFKKILTLDDIRLALELLKSHKEKLAKKNDPPYGMYV